MKKGDRFLHRHCLDSWSMWPTKAPLKCLVTSVSRGKIYYRADYGLHDDGSPWLGSLTHFDVSQIDRYVQEVLP